MVGMQHQLCERQPNKNSSSNVYNNSRIKTGWPAVCESQRTNWRWSDSERSQHINVLELKAAFLALTSFLKNQSHRVVRLRMDNTTAVAHVNNKGGTHSPCLLALTLELWQWCLERNIMISAQHVPGKLNTIADSESRVFNESSEWKIDPQTISSFSKGANSTCLLLAYPPSFPSTSGVRAQRKYTRIR